MGCKRQSLLFAIIAFRHDIFNAYVMVYTTWAYRVMRGKVTVEDIQNKQYSIYSGELNYVVFRLDIRGWLGVRFGYHQCLWLEINADADH